DGKFDLATADYTNVMVLLGNGDGTFLAPVAVNTGAGLSPVAVAAGDFNADGKLDLGVASSTYIAGGPDADGIYFSQATVVLGTGTGTFAPPNSVDSGFAFNGLDATALVADVNNDGKQDFVIGGETGIVAVHLGSGTGTLAAPVGGGIYRFGARF